MKRSILIALAVSASFATYSQNTVVRPAPSAPSAPSAPTAPIQPNPVQPAIPLQNGSQIQTTSQTGTTGGTNQLLPQPNQLNLESNRFSFQTNSSRSVVTQDHAGTVADQALLIQVRQRVVPRIQGMSPWAPVHFDVHDGVVTVLGAVASPVLQKQIVALVQQTPGVVNVVDQLTTTTTTEKVTVSPQDQVLLTRVRQVVLPQIQIGGMPAPVEFNVQQGVVTIIGAVPTIEQKHQIAALVQQVPGVVQVTDQVIVGRNNVVTGQPADVGSSIRTGTSTTVIDNGAAAGQNTTLTPTGRGDRRPETEPENANTVPERKP